MLVNCGVQCPCTLCYSSLQAVLQLDIVELDQLVGRCRWYYPCLFWGLQGENSTKTLPSIVPLEKFTFYWKKTVKWLLRPSSQASSANHSKDASHAT